MRIIFTLEAEQHADYCDSWWREHRPSNPGLFARELAEAKVLMVGMPSIGPVYTMLDGRPVRRIMLRKTRNHLYYVVEADCIVIHAV
jgi:hypothetical protein